MEGFRFRDRVPLVWSPFFFSGQSNAGRTGRTQSTAGWLSSVKMAERNSGGQLTWSNILIFPVKIYLFLKIPCIRKEKAVFC